jgi:protein-disulfide isomerase
MEQKEYVQHANAPAVEPSIEANTNTKKDRFLPISILVAAGVISGSILFASLYHPGSQAGGNNPAAGGTGAGANNPPATAETAAQINTLGTRDAALGSPNAPVTLIEYGDYQCPFCGRYFSIIEPQIMQQYVSTGKVKMIFRNFAFLGAESTAAAEAAECAADQNKTWAYHDALYQAKVNDVAKGGGENDGFFTKALFIQLAQNLHLDVPTFTDCVSNNKDGNLVAQDNQNAAAAGVNSTPTTFINGNQVTETDGSSAGADGALILKELAAATSGK